MSERSAVQNPMLQYAEAIGWDYVTQVEALRLRGGESRPFFADILRDQLVALNAGVVDAGAADEIIRQLGLLPATISGNRDALDWLQGFRSVYVPAEKRERNVQLIDFEHPERNRFHVTEEWWQAAPGFRNRADVVFLINGIPVAVAETKNPAKPEAIAEGVAQIRRYHAETPALFTFAQVFEVTHLIDFWYGATWSTNRKDLFNWKEVATGDFEHKVKLFFERVAFLKTLKDYIIFLTRDDILSKVILRQHQMRAVEKVVDRVMDGEKRRALIWHTQGSGKTLTMITIARKLLDAPLGAKPTVIMLVDRNELESQLFRNIAAYGITTVTVANNKQHLRALLTGGQRGLIVTMIHKFDKADADLNTRADIVVLVDEAHRTTGGDLGNYLLAAIPNASYIGFTGTPIDRLNKGKGTFKVFGPDDPQGYLDKYSIAESIADGTTVRLNYALAPSDLRVDRATLEHSFLQLAAAEGLSDIEELNGILDNAVELKEMMKNTTRVKRIAAFVAQDFTTRIAPMGFKAFLVAVDREACALYKQELDKHLPPEMSAVVYTSMHNDSPLLKRYAHTDEEERRIRQEFIKPGVTPQILIVTEKLLTGFDAPILYCMYLDKPMRDHVLLQAIARVNRPYEDDTGREKNYGFVLDFVGIFERLEMALAFDSDMVAAVIENMDVLKGMFAKWMTQDATRYLPFTKGFDDKAKIRAIEHFQDKKDRQEFYTFFRQLQNLYEVLSPDAFLRPFMDDYLALAALYGVLRNAEDRPYIDRELTAKTRALLREHTTMSDLALPGAIHELGVRELTALKNSTLPDHVKVLSILKAIRETIARDGLSQPFLLSIGERAEALIDSYEDRHQTTQQALAAFEVMAAQVAQSEAERTTLGLDPNTYAVYSILREALPAATPAQAKQVNAVITQYPEYRWNPHQQATLRTALYAAVIPIVGADAMIRVTDALLQMPRL